LCLPKIKEKSKTKSYNLKFKFFLILNKALFLI